ncbi:trypsin-like peptidase domain-containing protein [Verrucomicrobiaceae bacterium N1E253]|uniref:Trypsin-like peptidase domain-containing protein n=1 Tax=Oceaniferula marina TaxID=2748318 RepID=A0A851GJC3_9BACT|nr:S1C family serine protease [Oceaniferula marina]NWK57613.1 trypsin-like peptidase domain-containing protein [Oceaniferula marina]
MIKPIGLFGISLLSLSALAHLPLSAQEVNPLAPLPAAPAANQQDHQIYGSIVRIEAATQVPNYREPWKAGRFSGGIGTGFLIGPNRFLTNAHVVSNARRLLITKHGSPRKHPARIVHIAHDCDLALLEVDDPTAFVGLQTLQIGAVPKLESQVRVIGYPVGGNRISVTRGVVSRIDFNAYSHTRSDMHLVVQIDAAINPGNSGGPVLQNGHVVGVAFQGLRSADNTGYMIPTPVIRRFLKDIEDGQYDHYVDLGISEFPLFNPAMRKKFGLKQNDPGVLVARVTPEGPCDGVVKDNDILTAINGNTVDAAGNILIDGEKVNMNEIVERKFSGDTIKLDLIREGKVVQTQVTLKPFPQARMYSVQYGVKPRFTTFAGLVLQPLDRNLYAAHSFSNTRVRRLFAHYIDEAIFKERKDIVILTRILADPVNTHVSGHTGTAVESINGEKITSLQQAHELLHPETPPEFFVIKCEGLERPIVIPGDKAAEASRRTQSNYGINTSHKL